MDYRMYTGSVPAGKNLITLIKEDLENKGYKVPNLSIDFIGFEAAAGTEFTLNDSSNVMEVPSCGKFITPFDGERYLKIKSLVFSQAFSGNVYYII